MVWRYLHMSPFCNDFHRFVDSPTLLCSPTFDISNWKLCPSSPRHLPILPRGVLCAVARPLDSTELDPLCEIHGHTNTSTARHCLCGRIESTLPRTASRPVPLPDLGRAQWLLCGDAVSVVLSHATLPLTCVHAPFLSSHSRGVTVQGNARQMDTAQGAHGCC